MGIFQIDSVNINEGELVYVCGPTGGGKTTFLKRIKKQLGVRAGMVMQNPDSQIVNDRVYAELAFGPANQGRSDADVRRRVAETAGYFGISKWITGDTASLSGGEKQILAIASVMAMNPDVLLLDEPTAMLDPVMADRVIDLVRSMNRELGITVVIAEHRPDRLYADADLVIWIDGENMRADAPRRMAEYLAADGRKMAFLPTPARLYADAVPIPLTVKEAKKLALEGKKADGTNDCGDCGGAAYGDTNRARGQDSREAGLRPSGVDAAVCPVLELRNVTFGYVRNHPPVLSDVNLKVGRGEIFALLGENGSGKTTLASLAAGVLRPYSGTVKILGNKVKKTGQDSAMLMQDVTCHFTSDEGVGRFEGRHHYDLSGGEQQLMALEIVLANNPALLILDEPTKGLDAAEKDNFAKRLLKMRADGMAMLLITHDIEFAAGIADRMALLFTGEIAFEGTSEEFCGGNIFYTTAASRIFGGRI